MRELPGGRHAALTYTFDDGTLDHHTLCAPMLEEYGFRGTFFVLPGLTAQDPQTIRLPVKYSSSTGEDSRMDRHVMGWKQIRKLNERGHEIGNHGWGHMRLRDVDDPIALQRQIGHSAERIAREIGSPPDSWAWPYYRPGQSELSNRLVRQSHKIMRRRHPMLSFGDTMTPERAARWVEKAMEYGGWWIVVVHILRPDGSKHIFQVEEHILRASLKRAQELEQELWVCTMRELAPYLDNPFARENSA